MKKVLQSAAITLFILTLTGCAGTAGPVQTEARPPQTAVENVVKSPASVESEQISFSAGNIPPAEDSITKEDEEHGTEPEFPANPSPSPAPQEAPAPKVTPESTRTAPAVQEKTEEKPSPAPSADPEPDAPQAPAAPVEPETPAEPEPPEPAFSIDYWIAYAKDYARGAGLNLDPTAIDCWDNPITAGAHCIYLERDIQNRLNRYARDETILDVWIWAESRSDGSYDLYIGYA